MSAINYKRGFQRAYVLLSVVWVLGALWVLRPDRPSFWAAPEPNDWKDVDYDALAKQAGAVSSFGDPPAKIPSFEEFKASQKRASAPTIEVNPEDVQPVQVQPKLRIVKSELLPTVTAQSRSGKVFGLLGVVVVPPLGVYALLFLILPWVMRGFSHSPNLSENRS